MLTTLIIIAVAVAIYLYSQNELHKEKLRALIKNIDDLSPRLRISVVVRGVKGVGYISSLLRSESTSYQIVVVADYSKNIALLSEITHHFGLFAVSYTDSDKIQAGAIRTLYRSHRRLYSRVVLVDSPDSRNYTPFEVGAVASDFNYNLQLYSARTLRPEAIHYLLVELSMRHEGSVEKITSRIGERFKLVLREAALPQKGSPVRINKSHRATIKYKILESETSNV